ncbi:MAG TPA: hypothetical protein VED37_15860 [Ktedonobacteraceae bacterium]|nr:hypothetical protein [Ktedonobacteraceae bacterium]
MSSQAFLRYEKTGKVPSSRIAMKAGGYVLLIFSSSSETVPPGILLLEER